jgi:hypothetical protein
LIRITTDNTCFKWTFGHPFGQHVGNQECEEQNIVHFEIPELNKNKIEAKFTDTGGESVKEYLNIY